MRKLLVASQKSGVGKTTTSINLAGTAAMAGARVLLVETDPLNNVSTALNLGQHPQRKPLREAGIDMPGILCSGVLPGFDVLSPYEEGCCSDDDLDRLLQLLSLDAFRESYDCLIVNAPPFFGGRPGPLLASCEEFLVVMQAEPLAYRTMPAFLELVQRAGQGQTSAARMRGILLTLPETEAPGGRWERELRGRFGGRVLAQVIPYDEEAGKATLFGHVVVHASPEAPASVAFQEVVTELQLASNAKTAGRPVEATLTLAAAAVRDNPPVPRPVPPPPSTNRRSSAQRARLRIPGPAKSTLRADPPAPPRPSESSAVAPSAALERIAPPPPPPRNVPKLEETVELVDEPETPAPPLHSTPSPWFIWVGLAMAAGLGLRFIELPEFALPMMVGLAVAAGMTLVLHLLTQMGEEKKNSPAPAPSPATPSSPATGRRPLPPGNRPKRRGS